MKIGYVQLAPELGNPESTRDKVNQLLSQIEDVDLIVLPELCNSGYKFESREQALSLAEPIDKSPFLDLISQHCARLDAHVATGLNEVEDDKLFNTSVLMGPGGFVGKYRKLHLFWDEFDIFEKGNLGTPVFDLGEYRLGMLICFDWLFPEVWRLLALNGADIICHPSNLVLPGLCQKAIPVHAVINRVFAITANRIGTEGDLTFTGLSIMADPKANVLAQAPPDKEDVCVVDIDISEARNKQLTPRNHAFNDRRPQLYRGLVE